MARKRNTVKARLAVLDGVTLVVALGAFTVVRILVAERRTGRLDRHALGLWQRLRHPVATRAALLSTRVLSPAALAVLAALIAGWLQRNRRRQASQAVLGAAVLSLLSEDGLKLAFRRRRPPPMWFAKSSDLSFPSGHTVTSTALSNVLAYVLVREKLISSEAALAVAVLPPLVIGSTRIYLGRHWPTDVLGGWLLGIALSSVNAIGYEMMEAQSRGR